MTEFTLEQGSMDQVKTGDEALPDIKGVHVKITAPSEAQKANEIYADPDGKFRIARFGCQIQEGEFKGRFVQYSVFIDVTKAAYMDWNLKDGDRPLSPQEKEVRWEQKQYLSDLKRLEKAIEVDFTGRPFAQAIQDAYGKEMIGNTKQKVGKDGETRTEFKAPKKIKS